MEWPITCQDEVNRLLDLGYQIHCKDISASRAEAYAQTVKRWIPDPQHPHRQMGWADLVIDIAQLLIKIPVLVI